jgi:pSer/pThr/pTyr-binding forkhead associated (FHA) protein
MDAKLHVVDGAKPAIIRLRLPTVVGRSDAASLKVRNSQISRKHCEIDEYEGELVVRDLGSSNGTFVNDQRISEMTFLSPGDELRVGTLTLRADYEIAEPAATSTEESNDPHAADVVGDEPATNEPETGISSIVRYEEDKAGGSFLEIEEVEDTDASGERSADEVAAEESPCSDAADTATKSKHHIDLDTGSEKEKTIDPGDSRLKDFFNNLS